MSSHTASVFHDTVTAMGMPFLIEIHAPESDTAAAAAVRQFHAALRRADDVFSLFKDDSELSRLNRGELTVDECDPEMLQILQSCEWYRGATLGGFDARLADRLDPSGIVKGWAVAKGAAAFDRVGASAWMVGASGDILVSGEGQKWRVGIADPRVKGDPTGTPVIDVVTLGGPFRALATSGSAQHGDHIWDPTTGQGARHYLQVSVVADDLVNADAWATAIAAGGETVLSAALDAGYEALVVTNERCDGTFSAHASAGWPSVLE
ncbi:MAG: FAD:protein FMN transferase [Demequinaceae bacterium]|nr:FAD:protein FMN transferase [Demequinaceae bacterium]